MIVPLVVDWGTKWRGLTLELIVFKASALFPTVHHVNTSATIIQVPLINVATVAFQTISVPHNYEKSCKLNLLNNTAFLTSLNFNLVTVLLTSPSHTSFFFYFLSHTHFSVYFHLLTCCMSPSL